MSEFRNTLRFDRLEADMRDIKTALGRLEPMIIRIEQRLPHLATKADLADKPGRLYLWGVIGALLAGQAVILAAASLPPRLL